MIYTKAKYFYKEKYENQDQQGRMVFNECIPPSLDRRLGSKQDTKFGKAHVQITDKPLLQYLQFITFSNFRFTIAKLAQYDFSITYIEQRNMSHGVITKQDFLFTENIALIFRAKRNIKNASF
jgi:hypothetical protein